MNNKVLIGIIIILLVLLAWVGMDRAKEPVPSSQTGAKTEAAQQAPATVEIDAVDDLSVGRASHRTWVVYRTDQPANEHIGAGDAFRINKTGSTYKLIPLFLLRNRWIKPANFVLDLVKSPAGLLCGMVELTPHSSDPKHLIILEPKGPNELQVDYELFDEDQTVLDQCVSVAGTHAGRAHAEN